MISRAVAVPRNPGADLPLVVCVDPSIDVALLFADSVLTGGSRPGLPAGSIAGLTLTSSTSLFGFTPKPRRCGTRCGGCAESGDGRAMDRPLLAN